MIKKGFLLASFAIGVFANIFAQDTLSFKKTNTVFTTDYYSIFYR